MVGFTSGLVPGHHQVGPYLTLKSACERVRLLSDSRVLTSGPTQEVGDSSAQAVLKTEHDPPSAEWEAARNETLEDTNALKTKQKKRNEAEKQPSENREEHRRVLLQGPGLRTSGDADSHVTETCHANTVSSKRPAPAWRGQASSVSDSRARLCLPEP